MNNRFDLDINKSKKVKKINSFFLPCELKPYTPLFNSTIGEFCYDIQPAFCFATLGITSYKPNVYSIIKIGGESPVFGYLVTITNPDCIILVDRLKAFYGPGTININVRWVTPVYTDPSTVIDAWVYVLSDAVIEKFETIEVVKDGFHDYTDEKLFDYMDKLNKS